MLESLVAPLAVAAAVCLSFATARAGDVVPTDGMVIVEDTTFAPGEYELPNGVSIGSDGVVLDLNGATLIGAGGAASGVTAIGHDGIVIRNGVVRGYYYGVRIEDAIGVSVIDNELSSNWIDPASTAPGAPFLDINVGPNLPDFTNLGGGLYLREVVNASVTGNTLRFQENGIDAYFVAGSVFAGNDGSDNTGWGIHLHGSAGNTIQGNVFDRCTRPGLGDSAGVLLVNGSSGNQILENSFQGGGDGFFIGNENGCPSNDNLIAGNNGSNAGANAFEATFSSGNQFLDNTANGSNYGFWLGYSHSGNTIAGNQIKANNANGIEIEHGQDNTIEANVIVGNGGAGIVLRTDGQVHFPAGQFPCLMLPDQASSSGYTISGNVVQQNFGPGLKLEATTDSLVANNLLAANAGGNAISNGANVTWSVRPAAGTNIVGGPTLGGNYWSDYAGEDIDDDGLGDTQVPFTAGGAIAAPGDPHPLVGNPPVEPFDNPASLCARSWLDLGPNTRQNGQTFQTANGTHFATNGTDLYLLEGSNSTNFDTFDPATGRYVPRAAVPEAVFDGGGLQFGSTVCFATVGIGIDAATGAGKGPKLYGYIPTTNTWLARASTMANGQLAANEAIAFDPTANRIYATIVGTMNGAPGDLRSRLAIYSVASNQWIGTTAPGPFQATAGSEAEWHDGKVYVWRGGFAGGAVNGGDSYLDVYDIASDSWSQTATLQSAGIVPGFRSGAIDVWGVVITADHARGRIYVLGGESNKQVYLFDVATQSWTVLPTAIYDGGWGDGLEYLSASDRLYQIDGRNIGNAV
ncbi:MAG: right-handed parallel beta-helix repeat-containing protein, partial [Phycisphaerales bacterium]|nr:right-handed parallel beta-helix repeat-containing protein [Phycisphaerales bacterium]